MREKSLPISLLADFFFFSPSTGGEKKRKNQYMARKLLKLRELAKRIHYIVTCQTAHRYQ